MTDAKIWTGSCLCGSLKYSVTGEPLYRVACHCVNCRKVTGGLFMAASIYHKSAFKIESSSKDLKVFSDLEIDSETSLKRTFCDKCGSTMYTTTALNEEIISVPAGSLDDCSDWVPNKEQFCVNRSGWLGALEGWKKHFETRWERGPVQENVEKYFD